MKKEKSLTIVIKLGTSSIVDEKTHEPLLSNLSGLVETAVKLQHAGHRVVFVSSGAIGVGLRRMDIERKPKHLPKIQALAAIGQCRLMSLWDQLFGHMRQPVAQILLTRGDIADRTRYLNAQNTLFQLLEMGVIPIVNENDTIAVSEIHFGDNDTLSAITAGMIHADYLFLMTDVDCLYDKNPRTNPDAKAIEVVKDIAELDVDVSSKGSSLGTGGMGTKIVAARLATSAGVMTVITRSSRPGNIFEIVNYVEAQKALEAGQAHSEASKGAANAVPGVHAESDAPTQEAADMEAAANIKEVVVGETISKDDDAASDLTLVPATVPETTVLASIGTDMAKPIPLHTRFEPDQAIRDRSFWILHGLAPHGSLFIDEGAHKALATKAGLLPVGVVEVEGTFAQQECVRVYVVKRTTVCDEQGTMRASYDQSPGKMLEVGRAIVNYSSTEIKRIKGIRASEITSVLGYSDSEYVALRENLAFFKARPSRPQTPNLEHMQSYDMSSSQRSLENLHLRSPVSRQALGDLAARSDTPTQGHD